MKSMQKLSGMTLGEVQRTMTRDLLGLLDPIDIRVILCHVLVLSRTQIITQSDRVIDAEQSARLIAAFQRRLDGEPIAYITGEREFYSLLFRVTPDVLIPRPETELLVDLACERLPLGGRVLDMGTGSGAIAIAIAHARPDARVSALDASLAALAVAQENAARLLLGTDKSVAFLHSDWFDGLPNGEPFDLIVANPPYIAAGDAHLSQGDLRFEPPTALTDGADGLSALERIITGAPPYLHTNGWLLLEHGYDQAKNVRKLLKNNGFNKIESWRDLAGIERISGGAIAL